ncbi:hypothetical protein [Endozoicomonas sp. SCSIO W0465]|uniref:hypothetical protein n=1 Tax=Endozoicomonas sp. SCSIO W0465 TaxID=2918516 RepID=UPI00207535C4|nr:hypothetical protein [Endozoicomonas sp. SCSIO W0465]USE35180.1 hypothetical protein MJO57_24220 [Endozoicomonas sp. SCSIO W0465]
MAAPVSFGNGISGISRVDSTLVHSDFPKSKSNFKPSGDKVVDYTWKALDMSRNYENRELKFATSISGQNIYSSPEEHYRFTQDAIDSLATFLQQQPKNSSNTSTIKEALSVLEKAKADSEYLMMCRNVLIAS